MKGNWKKTRLRKRIIGWGLAAAAAGLLTGSIVQYRNARIEEPDYTGHQKFWTLNKKSMELHEGKANNSPIGETKYRLGKSAARFFQSHYDIHIKGENKGELEANFKVLGKEYVIRLGNKTTRLHRPAQFWRYRWELERNGKPLVVFQETHRSAWNPLIHEFVILDPSTGNKIGRLSAEYNLWRALTGRRDYHIRFEKGHKSTLSPEEIIAVLTALGKIEEKDSSSSSNNRK